MGEKILIPEKYGMVTCPGCNSHGYIQNPKRQPCPKCGGFGFIKKKSEQKTTIFAVNK
jgi:DnaJ-class molecular chaperone